MNFQISNAETRKQFRKHWQFCIGGEHTSYALRKDYLEQLAFVKERLGVKSLRFHGIFHEDMQVFMKLSDVMPFPGAEAIE